MYGPFDKQLELRNIADGAEVTSIAEAGKAFPVRMAGDFKAVIYVSDLEADGSPANEYEIVIQTDSTAAFNDAPVTVGSVQIFAPGVYEVPLSGTAVEQRDPDAVAIRVATVVDGGDPSITYGAYIAPAV